MTYKAILKSVEAKESWVTDGKEWTKYVFTFDNGQAPFVYRTDELNYQNGSELEYDLDKNKNSARIITKNPKANQTEVSYSTTKDNVQTYIIRQSSMNRATDLYQGQLFDWEKEENRKKLITLAREIEKYVHNG
ncbi:MAG: hypothetical protein Unbinned3528contig1000_3 [Prokaryotic dsDNA virus sp.]|nr:MAG: hypothetical protein Unbinned3528contig1000_3 [Prokaryotic dsDNA virus sp.]|tara:strand:- start:16087 stop:16488 length:402 start_codon:yes stop_codon:yes gene_type:complete